MSEITFEKLTERLLEVVPELQPQYESELEWWGDEQPGTHIIFGDVLNPYLISVLKLGKHGENLQGIFTFLEKLANHEDLDVQEVVAVTVCERLGDDPELLKKARKYMGETTLRFSQEIEQFWGRSAA